MSAFPVAGNISEDQYSAVLRLECIRRKKSGFFCSGEHFGGSIFGGFAAEMHSKEKITAFSAARNISEDQYSALSATRDTFDGLITHAFCARTMKFGRSIGRKNVHGSFLVPVFLLESCVRIRFRVDFSADLSMLRSAAVLYGGLQCIRRQTGQRLFARTSAYAVSGLRFFQ